MLFAENAPDVEDVDHLHNQNNPPPPRLITITLTQQKCNNPSFGTPVARTAGTHHAVMLAGQSFRKRGVCWTWTRHSLRGTRRQRCPSCVQFHLLAREVRPLSDKTVIKGDLRFTSVFEKGPVQIYWCEPEYIYNGLWVYRYI